MLPKGEFHHALLILMSSNKTVHDHNIVHEPYINPLD